MLREESDYTVCADICTLLARNMACIENGFKTLRAYARTNASGAAFLGALFDRCSTVLSESCNMLAGLRGE